jgi:hypothetical protein
LIFFRARVRASDFSRKHVVGACSCLSPQPPPPGFPFLWISRGCSCRLTSSSPPPLRSTRPLSPAPGSLSRLFHPVLTSLLRSSGGQQAILDLFFLPVIQGALLRSAVAREFLLRARLPPGLPWSFGQVLWVFIKAQFWCICLCAVIGVLQGDCM